MNGNIHVWIFLCDVMVGIFPYVVLVIDGWSLGYTMDVNVFWAGMI